MLGFGKKALCDECTAVDCPIKEKKGVQKECRSFCTDRVSTELWPHMKKIGDSDQEPSE